LGRTARGVRGISVGADDAVVQMETLAGDGESILTVSRGGYGKRTRLDEYRTQGRGGKGIINLKVTAKNGPVAGVRRVHDEDEVMVITSRGKIIRMSAGGISLIGRSTQGVRVIDVGEDDQVVSLARLPRTQAGES
ncbi:MAG: DNA gyrase C-terminal beta-propeller domain-containing protein, partial [Acidobacteriota bacterium]